MEKLFNRGSDDNNGNIVRAFRYSKSISVNIIYWDRAIAHNFQYSLFKSSFESIKKSQIAIPDIHLGEAPHAFISKE
jgi:hypothetical protein